MNTNTSSTLSSYTQPIEDHQSNDPLTRSHHPRLREPVETRYALELEALKRIDQDPRPPQWRLSPQAVLTYMMGGVLEDGFEVTPKFIGSRGVIEVAISTLITDRALLLIGIPGTGKSWVAEHLAAAISGDSTLIVQGTAGCGEESIRYGWNYAELLSRGPRHEALVASPIMRAMQLGKIARVEELTRLPQAVQDAMITILSEKMLPIPELGESLFAQRGFGLIATANHQDQGVNALSSALRRRFNIVTLPTPATLEDELTIVRLNTTNKMIKSTSSVSDVSDLANKTTNNATSDIESHTIDIAHEVVGIFRDLRGDGDTGPLREVKHSGQNLSPADAIAVVDQVSALSVYFRGLKHAERALAEALYDAVVKESKRDATSWTRYVKHHLPTRSSSPTLHQACLAVIEERAA